MEAAIDAMQQRLLVQPELGDDRLAEPLLQRALALYYEGPLSMQEQARNAVRRGFGGVNFKARVRALPLPAALREYLLCRVPSLQLDGHNQAELNE